MAGYHDKPAFPSEDRSDPQGHRGLTTREYFAAKALAGIIVTHGLSPITPDLMATMAVEYADALMKELRKDPAEVG